MFISIILPFTTFVHELGHAIVAAHLLKVPVEIKLGTKFNGKGITLGKIHINIQLLSGWVGFFNFKATTEKVSKSKYILIFLAGPLFSFLLSTVCFTLLTYSNVPMILNDLVRFIMNAALVQFLITIIPFKYPAFLGSYSGLSSDGYNIIKVMRQR
nr:M50 family metallopeptidase [Metabacillus crassostreae]